MKLIDTAISHFSNKTVRSMVVPEWDITVYAKPLSLEDKAKWITRSDGDNTDYMVYALIFGLMDDKGDTLFDIGDKVKLRKSVDPEVVGKLASFVLGADSSEEEREKN